jgi:hypothetical protein
MTRNQALHSLSLYICLLPNLIRLVMYDFCKRCKKKLTKKQAQERKIKGLIPLCEKCADELDVKLSKWSQQFQKMRLS